MHDSLIGELYIDSLLMDSLMYSASFKSEWCYNSKNMIFELLP